MASRFEMKFYLKLSLVTCPVVMTPAKSERGKVRFHTLNRATLHRVQARSVDAETGKPVAPADEVKGYDRGDGSYVMLEDDELDSVALESARMIDIETFAPSDSIGWIWYDSPHYLLPADKIGEEAFAVIREAMRATKTVGISRLVLYRRERAVLLEPRDKGIVLWTLRYGDEVRDEKDYFAGFEGEKPDAALTGLVGKLIKARLKPWSPELTSDPVQARLLDIIEARKTPAKKAKAPTKRAEGESNVIDIMEALRRSLGAKSGAKKAR